jgi:hypothetical protein
MRIAERPYLVNDALSRRFCRIGALGRLGPSLLFTVYHSVTGQKGSFGTIKHNLLI